VLGVNSLGSELIPLAGLEKHIHLQRGRRGEILKELEDRAFHLVG
jgi:hypothetical protein